MRSNLLRFAALAAVAVALAGCASGGENLPPEPSDQLPNEPGQNLTLDTPAQAPLQCVPYAREHSGVKLYGDAWTWWDRAAGKFPRLVMPEAGTVMVLAGYAGPQSGHVAVVRKLISPREIRVDHANWLDDGSIYVNDPVVDVSDANNWSAVKVWNIKTGGWGSKIYPVQGFIGPNDANQPSDSGAPTDDASDARIASAGPDEDQ